MSQGPENPMDRTSRGFAALPEHFPRNTRFKVGAWDAICGVPLTARPPGGEWVKVGNFPTDEAAREHIRQLKNKAYHAERPHLRAR